MYPCVHSIVCHKLVIFPPPHHNLVTTTQLNVKNCDVLYLKSVYVSMFSGKGLTSDFRINSRGWEFVKNQCVHAF